MTFLNPFVLLGLLAAAIPVLLHIFNLRKLKTIEFSSLTFLKELQKTKIRRLKVRQILLLILRTLFIVLTVFAFSRPTLTGSLSGGFAKTSAVMIIDDSYSMTAFDGQGELLKQAKQSALQALDLLKEGDEVFILKLSDANVTMPNEPGTPIRSFAQARSAVNEIKPSYTHRKLEPALRFAARMLSGSANFNKEIFVFSDFQSGILNEGLRKTSAKERIFPPGVRCFFSGFGNRQMRNVSLDAVTIPNTLFEVGKPFSVIAKVTNHGTGELPNVLVSVFTSGTRVAQKGVTVQSGKSTDVELSIVPKQPGFIEGVAALEDDDLEFDNRRYFTVTIPGELHALLVGTLQDLQYIKLALSAVTSGDSTTLKLAETTVTGMTENQISWADIILFSNVKDLSTSRLDRLRSFLASGGGLIIFPGASTTAASFNSTFAAALGLPPILSVEGDLRSQTSSFLEIEKSDIRHPLFAGLFEDQGDFRLQPHRASARTLESPKVRAHVKFAESPQSSPVISLSDGSAFLLDKTTAGGRVLLFGVAANLEWSDFPIKGLFAPLLHRTLSYLAQRHSVMPSIVVSEAVQFPIRRSDEMKFILQDPRKNELTVQAFLRGTEKSVLFSDTYLPGIYFMKSGNRVIQSFAVNMDPDESKTEKAETADWKALMNRLGIDAASFYHIEDSAVLKRSVSESRYGVELWKYFLIAALGVALLEMFIARDTKRALTDFTPHLSHQ